MTFIAQCRSKIEKATPNPRCPDCDGTGINQHDTDPMGGLMNTPCYRCKSIFNFDAFSRSAFPEALWRLEKAISMLKAADPDLNLPLVRMRIKDLEAPFESREN